MQATFTATVKLIKQVSADDRFAVSVLAKNTPFLDRDLLMKAASGLLIQFIDDDGVTWVGRRQVYPDIQAALDSISTMTGVMLVRLDEGWLALMPGQPGQVLTMNDDGTVPFWDAAQGGGGGGNGATVCVPDLAEFNATNAWAPNDYILCPIFLLAGSVVRGGRIPFSATDASVKWSVGLYDGDWNGPANPLAHSAQQVGCIANDMTMISFANPYKITADGVYWIGGWADSNIAILSAPPRIIRFWTNAAGDWTDVSPSVGSNTAGASSPMLITFPAPSN